MHNTVALSYVAKHCCKDNHSKLS